MASATTMGTATWALENLRYRRRLRADPEHPFLAAPPVGRPLEVEASDGTRLHAEVFGPEDAPTIVLIHGWMETLQIWLFQLTDLSRRDFRVVTYDLRGHGRSSSSPHSDYSMAAYGDDVEAVLRAAVPEGERAVLAGHSLGAMSIASWAERHPVTERVSAAAFVCTGLVDLLTEHAVLRPPWIPATIFGPISAYVLSVPGTIPGFSPSVLDAIIRYVAFGPGAGPAVIAFLERMIRNCPSDVRAATARSMSNMDLLHALANVTVPTLIVSGSQDRLTPASHADRIAAALPAPAKAIVLPRCGHMAPLERPAELNRWLRALATRAEAAPTPDGSLGVA